MKLAAILSCIFLFILILVQAGCEPPQVVTEPTPKTINGSNELSIYLRYAPAKVYILPVTEFIAYSADTTLRSSASLRSTRAAAKAGHVRDAEEQPEIKVYVSLLDSFGSQIKSPGVFRFELYEYVQRSAEPKGKRVAIWLDIDLNEPVKNDRHWRDFLRAYEFNLPFEPESNKSYIIQATCLCPNGRRLSAEFALKHKK